MDNSSVLYFAYDDETVNVHANKAGIDILIDYLESLKKKIEKNECEHYHLSSESWGGHDLTELQGTEKGQTINQVTFYGWTEEFAKKEGFTK